MSPAFGTDGVRGDARTELTEAAVFRLGLAGAEVLGPSGFAVGRDPRASGPALARALLRGVEAAGGSPVDLGVAPTPAVARWCRDRRVAGAVVSASHNPWHDNGVKFFAAGGHKLDDAAQTRIERLLARLSDESPPDESPPAELPLAESAPAELPLAESAPAESAPAGHGYARPPGSVPSGEGLRSVPSGEGLRGVPSAGEEAAGLYAAAVVDSLQGRDLAGLRVVVDCANGAASELGPACLRWLGASVEAIHAAPDGRNINCGCGSLHPESLQDAVVSTGADAGIAFDGDADRVVAVDHTGALVDGDQILAVCAVDRHRRGTLDGGAVVITVMANLGLRQAMAARGIAVVETAVGDRHVLDALAEHGLVLGGEQSGHLIFRDLATTGDGLLTAVQLLDAVKRSGRSLADAAAAAMTRLPQVLVGVPLGGPVAPEALEALEAALDRASAEAEARLGGRGRVLVRLSGTEPVVRVMVEAGDEATARACAERAAAGVAAAVS